MSTILIVSVIILQQGEHIIYPIMTTTTRQEDEHIIAIPSYGLFLLPDRKSTHFKKDQHEEANEKQ
ncbi:MAG: hypothetical protein WCF23_07205 [Candidatus Nitrosopolaris sp.]